MTLTRILTAASLAALFGGTAALAQDNERPTDVYGHTAAESAMDHSHGATMSVTTSVEASSASESAMPASTLAPDNAPGTITTSLITNGPVPDTAENRALYGGPQSRAGKMTAPVGN